MQTRCIRCGKTIDGFAQFCDACEEHERQESVLSQPPSAPEARDAGKPHQHVPNAHAHLHTRHFLQHADANAYANAYRDAHLHAKPRHQQLPHAHTYGYTDANARTNA